ncbi:MAG: T9SS type A sorting domain-containing protein [Bacteroidales bacterium]
MRKLFFFIAIILFPLINYSQNYLFEINREFQIKEKNLSFLSFSGNKLYLYDSTVSIIYLIDTNGVFRDSLNISFKANGVDVYKDKVYLQKEKLTNKNSSILKIDFRSGVSNDFITWSIGERASYANLLCVNSNYAISYIFAGWSSSIVQIDLSGKIIKSLLISGLGNPVDFSFISENKFCLITNTGSSENGYYFEYEIGSEDIHNIVSIEIPIKDPKGIAFANDSVFYVYSGFENTIYEVKKKELATGIELINCVDKEVIIYPNPTKDNFKIVTNFKIDTIEILNTNGEKINFYRKNDLVYLDNIPTGIYFIVIQTNNNTITKKLIIN